MCVCVRETERETHTDRLISLFPGKVSAWSPSHPSAPKGEREKLIVYSSFLPLRPLLGPERLLVYLSVEDAAWLPIQHRHSTIRMFLFYMVKNRATFEFRCGCWGNSFTQRIEGYGFRHVNPSTHISTWTLSVARTLER